MDTLKSLVMELLQNLLTIQLKLGYSNCNCVD